MLRVRDLMMKDLATVQEQDHLDLADDIMMLGRIRHLPVVRDDTVVGVLSQRDLFRAAASCALDLRRTAQHQWLGKILVRDVMSAPPVTIAPDADLGTAAGIMLERRIGCLVVADAEKRLLGILSEADCLRVLKRILDSTRVREELAELTLE
jgi:CBS domain-containing protein